ncbi:hypothetical protein LSH36_1212g00000 [Paralvinella palmiformis]|uniref:Sm protein G n=1 Tax=Paralvinella palmiformis TaxID=53620 RepID=A0AAD9IU46_9ANNE|nr:hypothetical protein LSH36_1212g00000 [Paralvinella palmiformis]
MGKAHPGKLKKYMHKKLQLCLIGSRIVVDVLRKFDKFMNIAKDEAVQKPKTRQKNRIGHKRLRVMVKSK